MSQDEIWRVGYIEQPMDAFLFGAALDKKTIGFECRSQKTTCVELDDENINYVAPFPKGSADYIEYVIFPCAVTGLKIYCNDALIKEFPAEAGPIRRINFQEHVRIVNHRDISLHYTLDSNQFQGNVVRLDASLAGRLAYPIFGAILVVGSRMPPEFSFDSYAITIRSAEIAPIH